MIDKNDVNRVAVGLNPSAQLQRMLQSEPRRLRQRSLSLGVPLDDADDAAQKAALRAWRSVETLRSDGAGAMCAWLDIIVRNTAIDMHRTRKDDLGEVMCDRLQSDQNVEADVELNERLAAAFTLIDQLPEQLRRPLLMSVVDELDATQIADQLGITSAAVRQRIARARRALRQ